MSRADEVRARYEEELALAELEDELAEAKQAGTITPELKLKLRQARRAFRLRREGSADAQAQTVQTTSATMAATAEEG